MTDFIKLINPFNLISFLYEQFTPVHYYEFKNRTIDYFSEEEYGEIEDPLMSETDSRFTRKGGKTKKRNYDQFVKKHEDGI